MEATDKVYFYGASGHAKVVMDMARLVGIDVPCLVDDNPLVVELAGVPVVHSADGLSPIIVTIGNCKIRQEVVKRLWDRQYLTMIHPSAVKAEGVKVGEGTVVMAGAVLQTGVSIGRHCIINTGASIDHDCMIEDFAHIAPHCTLCGGVEVGEGTWVGAGTTVIQGIHIGKNCYIGAGSVIVKDIPDGTLCYGNPARVIRMVNKNADNQINTPGGGRISLHYAAFNRIAA